MLSGNFGGRMLIGLTFLRPALAIVGYEAGMLVRCLISRKTAMCTLTGIATTFVLPPTL